MSAGIDLTVCRTSNKDDAFSRLLISAKEAAVMCGISKALWDSLTVTGRNPKPIKLGRRRLWLYEEIVNWISAGCPSRDKWELIK